MEKIVTPKFRVSFPNVFEKGVFDGEETNYNLHMLFPKTTDLTPLKELAKKAILAKWPDKNKRPSNLNQHNPFRDGDVEKPDVAGYVGMIFVKASSKMRPGVVDQNVQPIIDAEEFYAGCYARATITAYTYNKMGNAGVAFGLQNIQKLEDGEPFTGRSKPEDDFDAVAAENAGSTDGLFDDPEAPTVEPDVDDIGF